MYESLSDQPQFLFVLGLAAIFFGTLTLTVLGIMGMWTWRKHRTAKMENDLKLEMLAAGMSAGEIVQVLAAKMSGR
jgi:hypothetical protein